MHRNQSVSVHEFAMVPRADVPRSSFDMQSAHKTTFDAGYLIPVYVDEVLPGDTFSLKMTAFARMSTPIFPIMDNMYLDSHFFFIPNRLLWNNWVKFMGEQDNPSDSISYIVPTANSPAGGYAVNSLQDYMGLPTVGQVTAGQIVEHNTLALRAYNLVWNEWYRDENLQNSVVVDLGDGPDLPANYSLLRRGKRHDYFTSCLPWPNKGGVTVPLPLGSSAPVYGTGKALGLQTTVGVNYGAVTNATGTSLLPHSAAYGANSGVAYAAGTSPANLTVGVVQSGVSGLFADLSQATAATINQLRQSFAIQRLLERDARGGTRYAEIVRAHFGVVSPDARLQRPEYLGGGSTPIVINPIAQTSGTGATGQTTPLGNLGAMATTVARGHGFTQSFTEHGIVLGIVSVRADYSYQQGLRRMWSRSTRYDFYFPAFAHLGEQAVLNKEIYSTGVDATDNAVFGYQERWAEYRYHPSSITGLFRSTSAGTLDAWHLGQRFTTQPALNASFIQETPPLDRVLAVGAAAGGKQFIFDSFFNVRATRPMPLYSVPGMMDHF